MSGSVEALVRRIGDLAEQYKASGVEPSEDRFLGSGGGDQSVPFWQFENGPLGREEREIAREIARLNPQMLSREDVQHQLRYPLLTNLIDNRDAYDSGTGDTLQPVDAVHRTLEHLSTFTRTTSIEIPVLHSPLLRGDSLSWGGVDFKGINPWSDLGEAGPELKYLIDHFDGRLNGWAKVECPGDQMRSWHYLTEAVETAHRQMVGAAWPRHGGSGHTPPSLPGRGADASFTPRFEGGRLDMAMSTRVAPGHAPYRVPRDLEGEWGDSWPSLLEIAQRMERTESELSLMDALGWLGSATEPDLPAMKIVKVATALETLIAEHDPNVTSQGITSMLAERTALLVGSSVEERLEIDRQVRQLYGLRSAVLHRRGVANEDDVADAGLIVWRACRAFLDIVPEVTDAGGLRDWALLRRYS